MYDRMLEGNMGRHGEVSGRDKDGSDLPSYIALASGRDGAAENAIQRVRGQVRPIKLDIEVNANTKFIPSPSPVAVVD